MQVAREPPALLLLSAQHEPAAALALLVDAVQHAPERGGEPVDLLGRLVLLGRLEVGWVRRVDRLHPLDQPVERREPPAEHEDVDEQHEDDREPEQRELDALIDDREVQVRGRAGGEQRRHDHQDVRGHDLAG